MDKAQHEYYLRQQLRAIQKELGEADTSRTVVEDYRQKIAAARLPDEARHEALRELARLQSLPPQAPEYGIIETYLEWLVALPWHTLSMDHFDLFIEATRMPGRGRLTLTGQLGDVMRESAQIAYSYVRSKALEF